MALLSSLIKKKLSDDQISNIFINGLFDVVENGFKEIADLINEDVVFVKSPEINQNLNGEFALIVIAANLSTLESTFEADQAVRVEQKIFEKLGKLYEMSTKDFESLAREYQSFIAKVNKPSKNLVYGMSKAIFEKYELNEFQDEYFRRMQAPNPLFLKRLDEVMINFIWNWDAFFKKYKLN
ncbi:MAG: hypothetical protein ACON4M_02485 [Crocinitomicaceae bacterium]